jgi:hypothetical protein
MRSPTQRSLNLLRERGYLPYITETWNPYSKRRNDLYGFADIVAIKVGEPGVLAVQTTSGTNLSARIKKAESLSAFRLWLAAGNPVEFHGWRKLLTGKKQRTWQPLIRRFSIQDLF